MAKTTHISGFPEWLPFDKEREENYATALKTIAKLRGFLPLETSAVENLSTLTRKGEIDKEIFTVSRLSSQEEEKAGSEKLALHFDLTVPFARYVADHQQELVFPFKRIQLQKSWRGERPQKGRAREFYQCDFDIVAREELPIACDAEILSIVDEGLRVFNFGPHEIRVNNRKLLAGLYESYGVADELFSKVLGAVDKVEKIGPEKVSGELLSLGLPAENVAKIVVSTKTKVSPKELANLKPLSENERFQAGLAELEAIIALLSEETKGSVLIDLSLARGLDYYTGIIFEAKLTNHLGYGSVSAGGRYENLTSQFSNTKLPGVGGTIGLTRLMELGIYEQKFGVREPSGILITALNDQIRPTLGEVAAKLRRQGVTCEVYPKSIKLGKQIEYAEKRGYRSVVFSNDQGSDLQIKDLVTKEQKAFTP